MGDARANFMGIVLPIFRDRRPAKIQKWQTISEDGPAGEHTASVVAEAMALIGPLLVKPGGNSYCRAGDVTSICASSQTAVVPQQ